MAARMRIKVAPYVEHLVDALFSGEPRVLGSDDFGDILLQAVLEKAIKGDMDAIAWLEKHRLLSVEISDPHGLGY